MVIRCIECGADLGEERPDPLYACEHCGTEFVVVRVAAGPCRIRVTGLQRGRVLLEALDRLAGVAP